MMRVRRRSATPEGRTSPVEVEKQRRPRWRWVLPTLMVLAWLVFGGFSSQFQSRLAEVQKNDNASFLPASAESTEATNLQASFSDKRVLPAVLVFERPAGLTMTDQNALQDRLVQLAALPGVNGQITPP